LEYWPMVLSTAVKREDTFGAVSDIGTKLSSNVSNTRTA
jgi:hypothetical protein